MKKTIYAIILLTTILVGCKKDKNEPVAGGPSTTGGGSVNTTPAYVPPKPGFLKVNVNSLTMHPGNNSTILATLYNDTGGVVLTSGLIWNSSNTSVANVSGGLVTANAPGNCEVTVTDGIHGILVVNVSVVSNTINITNTPTSISWSFLGDVLAIPTNSMSTIANYTVYNSQGVAVYPSLTFIPPANSGLTFSGNTINSGSVTGSFDVIVKAGNDTLKNTLNIVVMNTDTVYSFDIVQGTLPRVFYKNAVAAANPLLINVKKCWYSAGTPTFSTYITSPETINIYGDQSVQLNASGKLESVQASTWLKGAWTKISYKGAFLYRDLYVCSNISGNWGTTLSNGNTYNYCITQTGSYIYYDSNEYFVGGSPQYISGVYYVVESGATIFYGTDNLFTGVYNPTYFLFEGDFDIHYTGTFNPHYFYLSGDNQVVNASVNKTLQRGAGNCVGSSQTSPCTNDSIGLLNILISGGVSTIWLTSPCYSSESGITSYTFNNDFTGSFQASSSGTHTMSWKIRKAIGQTGCIYEFYAWKVDGNTTGIPYIGESFLSPYSGTVLQCAQPGTSCSPNLYYFTKQ